MKRLSYILIASSFILFSACKKKNEHKVRVNNKFYMPVTISIGSVSYGTVPNGIRTDYKVIPEGTHDVTGDIQGSLSLSGKGEFNWTMTVGTEARPVL